MPNAPTVEFIPFLAPGLHPGMDALAFGLADELELMSCALRVRPMRSGASIGQAQSGALHAALKARADAVVLFVLDPCEPAHAVEEALSRGVPVISVHKPAYLVAGAVLVPNFYHGVLLSQRLARALPSQARIAIIGGPQILDDEELVVGLIDGAKRSGLQLLNDPFEARFRNLADVRGAGREVAERILNELYPFDGLIVFNGETLHDVLDAVERRGLAGRFPIVSRNGSPAAVDAVKAGRTLATLDYGLPELGRAAGRLAVAALADRSLTEQVDMPVVGTIIDEHNASEYSPWHERAAPRNLFVAR
ncbi:MAG TPA: substrate-binding domain-containing protein [Abditibacteriaceae bacterium]|jgi:ABC-type sugar transport system substrate-binding protein